MLKVWRTAEMSLVDILKLPACRKTALGTDGTVTRIRRGLGLTEAFNVMQQLVEVLSGATLTGLAETASASCAGGMPRRRYGLHLCRTRTQRTTFVFK